MNKGYFDILIKVGRKWMEKLALELGRTHPRVLRCSRWLDKHIYKVQEMMRAA